MGFFHERTMLPISFFHFTHLIDVPAIFWERNSISSLNNNSSNWDNNYIWHPQQNCDIYLEHVNMVFHFNPPFEVLIKVGTQQKHYLRTQGHLDIWSLLRGSWHKNFTDPNCLLQSTKLNLKLKFENLFHFLKFFVPCSWTYLSSLMSQGHLYDVF